MQIGRYQVISHLGRGGMADIFKCRLSGIGGFEKIVVLKRMLPQLLENAEFGKMFLDEARIAASLNHPNIVQIFEIDQHEGVPYIAMEYVRGPTFAQLLRRMRADGPPDPRAAVWLLSELCLALTAVHEARGPDGLSLELVHRDVTPQNIIVGKDGTAKLLDFGIAKAEGKISQTKAGTLKGKIAFMAPEQVTGDGICAATDLFAVGVCLYVATTGKMPFGGASEVAILHALLDGTYPDPATIVPDFPPALAAILHRALQPEVSERYATAAELREELLAWLATQPGAFGKTEVALLIEKLYPNDEFEAAARPVTDEQTTGDIQPTSGVFGVGSWPGGSGSRPGGNTPPPAVTPPPVAPASKLPLIVGGIVLAVILALVGWIALRPPPGAPVAPIADEGAAARGKADAQLGAYLDEVERLTAGKRYAQALEILGKARDVKTEDAALDIRRSRVEEAAEIAAWIAMARRDLEAGEVEKAAERAKLVLERDFENAEALALLEKATPEAAPSAPDAAAGAGAAVVAARGTVRVESNHGGVVYLDGRPAGRAPVPVNTSVGAHVIEVRAPGFQPFRARIDVVAGENPAVLAKLLAAAQRSASTDAAELAALSAASPAAAKEPAPAATNEPAPAATKEPAPAAVVAAKEPAPAAVVAAKEPAPAAVVAAKEPAPAAGPEAPRLPAVYSVTNVKELARTLRLVEQEVVTKGRVPKASVTDVTALLAAELAQKHSPGQPIELYPAGIFWLVVDLAGKGGSREAIAQAIVKKHRDKSLRSLTR